MGSILILGKDGQVGVELQRSLAHLGQVTALGSTDGNLKDQAELGHTLARIKPSIIVNAAAYTAVDKAEDPLQYDEVQTINAKAVETLGQYGAKNNALVVHYSTDYVFDGTQTTPYTEQDTTNPVNIYGQSKLDGEIALGNTGAPHLIFRTSWVYAAHGNNFLRTMMRLAMQRDALTVVNDQFGAPTSAELLADVTALAIWAHGQEKIDSGLYHLTAAGQTSWHGFAHYIVQQMIANGMTPTVQPDRVLAIPSANYPTPAQRPMYSHLDNRLLEDQLGISMPHWQFHVRRAIAVFISQL